MFDELEGVLDEFEGAEEEDEEDDVCLVAYRITNTRKRTVIAASNASRTPRIILGRSLDLERGILRSGESVPSSVSSLLPNIEGITV